MKDQSLKGKSINLQKAFLCLKNEDEVFNFLRDLCTETEIEEFIQRLEIAKMLYHKETYKNIEQKTHISSTTIARVAKFLTGKWGGYQIVLKKLKL